MRHTLRPYQSEAVSATIAAIDRKPILVAPTGSGKTVMATEIVERLHVPTLWLAHRKELVEQAAGRLEAHGLVTGIIKAGVKPMPLAPVQVASIHTLIRRDRPEAALIVIDECHHATAETYRTLLDEYPKACIVGLTATPFRLDGAGLGDIFGEIVVAAWPDQLCKDGTLHAPKVWCAEAPDLSGIRVIGGDYALGALAGRMNRPKIVGDMVEAWTKHARGRRTVVFAIDVPHSKAIVERFGSISEHLDGTTPDHERAAILKRLKSGETTLVSNCMVLTEGWDLPALECAIIARPTASLNLHLQMIGRVMRACDDKEGAVVLDHAGNHHVHGLVTRRLNYTLKGAKVGSSEPLGLRRCRQCGLLFDVKVFACPECGWAPAAPERVTSKSEGPGKLTEYDDSLFEYRRNYWSILESERAANGFKEGWSFFRFRERFGTDPVVVGGELINPFTATMDQKRAAFERLSERAEQHGFKPGWASWKYKDIFGVWPSGFVGDVRRDQMRQRFMEASR